MNRKALYNTFYKPFRKRFDPKTSSFGKAFLPKKRFVLKEKLLSLVKLSFLKKGLC